MKNFKKLSRSELKKIGGGVLQNPDDIGCASACAPGNGYCEQYGLSCNPWVTMSPAGDVTLFCMKCT